MSCHRGTPTPGRVFCEKRPQTIENKESACGKNRKERTRARNGLKAKDLPGARQRLQVGTLGGLEVGIPPPRCVRVKAVDKGVSGRFGVKAVDKGVSVRFGVPLGFVRGKRAVDKGLSARSERRGGCSRVGKERRNGGTVSRTLTKEYRTCAYLSSDKLKVATRLTWSAGALLPLLRRKTGHLSDPIEKVPIISTVKAAALRGSG